LSDVQVNGQTRVSLESIRSVIKPTEVILERPMFTFRKGKFVPVLN